MKSFKDFLKEAFFDNDAAGKGIDLAHPTLGMRMDSAGNPIIFQDTRREPADTFDIRKQMSYDGILGPSGHVFTRGHSAIVSGKDGMIKRGIIIKSKVVEHGDIKFTVHDQPDPADIYAEMTYSKDGSFRIPHNSKKTPINGYNITAGHSASREDELFRLVNEHLSRKITDSKGTSKGILEHHWGDLLPPYPDGMGPDPDPDPDPDPPEDDFDDKGYYGPGDDDRPY